MEASFANMQTFIGYRLNNYSQDVLNFPFAAPSPVPAYQVPSQGNDPSMRNPRTGFGPGGETEEPGQDESATSSFLAALSAAGISVPQGVEISARVARESSSGSGRSAVTQAGTPQGAQAEVPQGCSSNASGSTATEQVNLRASMSGISPHEEAFRAFSFADVVQEFADDDVMSSASGKGAGFEGHCSVLRLLYQLCPAAAPESPPALHRVCDFEGLFASDDRPSAAEGVPTLFHRVLELRAEHRQRFRTAAETGKPPSSALSARGRDRAACLDPSLAAATPANTGIPRLVGSLSNKCLLSFSFDETARVESLCKELLASQSSSFWLFSALLHWLKELGFVPPDPALFGQLVQEMSGSMVSSASNSVALATFLAAKRREGDFIPLSFSCWCSF